MVNLRDSRVGFRKSRTRHEFERLEAEHAGIAGVGGSRRGAWRSADKRRAPPAGKSVQRQLALIQHSVNRPPERSFVEFDRNSRLSWLLAKSGPMIDDRVAGLLGDRRQHVG